jgi:hypothetical protein
MGFSKPKSDHHRRDREWQEWIGDHRSDFVDIGLPAEVFLDETRWQDFLGNGHLHWHETSGFEFSDLSDDQHAKLRHFLEGEYGTDELSPPLLNWLRVRGAKHLTAVELIGPILRYYRSISAASRSC